MSDALIIGLPKAVRQPFDTFANAFELVVVRVYAEVGGKGSHVLLPKPEHCIGDIRRYLDGHDGKDYSGARILVLPYALLPEECLAELEIAAEMGAAVHFVDTAVDPSWPKVSRRHKPDKQFHDRLLHRLQEYILSLLDPNSPPSVFVERLAAASGRLLLADGALETCDAVASLRYEFIRKAVLMLVNAAANGFSTRFDQYCADAGLNHAQSGGSTVTIKFYGGGDSIGDVECNTHLKLGDKTTPQAAARVYYSFVDVKSRRYAAILYAGTHPNGNFVRRVKLPED